MKCNFLIFCVSAILLVNGCQEYSTGSSINGHVGFVSERSTYVLDGKVLDMNSIPIFGAEIHYMFRLKNSGLGKIGIHNKTMPNSTITFDITNDGHTSLRVYRLGTRELITTLADTILRSGRYSVAFDAGSVTNGMYVYQIISEKIFEERLMAVMQTDVDLLLKTKPLATTDVDGKFRLPQSLFGLDEEFSLTNGTGSVISKATIDSIAIVINHNTKHPLIQWMKVNKTSNMEATFTLQ